MVLSSNNYASRRKLATPRGQQGKSRQKRRIKDFGGTKRMGKRAKQTAGSDDSGGVQGN